MGSKCCRIHEIVSNYKRYTFPYGEKDIAKNGIYLLFEKGEYAHGLDRIVRVGTHTGNNQLASGLAQHFMTENKDRSIFRKNIGRVILNINNDSYKTVWEYDLTTRSNKEKYNNLIEIEHQKEIEREISSIIQEKFSFIVIPVDNV